MILVTGGAGFIGSCFIKKLNNNGINDIIIIDNLRNEDKWKNLVGKKFNDLFIKDNINLTDLFDNGYYNIETIFHFGACTDTTEKNADYLLENNFKFSKILAEYALKHNIRFIYASSAATYGSGENGYSDYRFEDLKPLNMYGFSKHLFDLWIIDNRLDKKFVGLKFFNVFGPNEYHKGEMSSMAYKAYNQIIQTGKVKLFKSNNPQYSDGEQKRDFIYVIDVINIIWEIYQNKRITGIYNLGSGIPHCWNELISYVFEAMNLKPNIEYIDMPDELQNQYQYFTEAKMDKLKEAGCSLNFHSLKDCVKDYIQNYLTTNWKYY